MRLFFCPVCNTVTNLSYCKKCNKRGQEIKTINYVPDQTIVTVEGNTFEISQDYTRNQRGRQQNNL